MIDIIFILAGKHPQLTADFKGDPVSQVQVQEYSVQHKRNKTNLKTKQIYKKQHAYKKKMKN